MPGPAPSRPPRLPAAPGSKIALDSELGLGVASPSVLRQVVAAALETPTDIAPAPDGTLFFTERKKGLSVQRVGQPASKLFAPADLEPGPGAAGGMHSVAVDPRFAVNRHVYIFMRSNAEGRPASRVVRLTLDGALASVAERRDIVVIADVAPATTAPITVAATATSAPPTAGRHLGGVLRFGPDGHLYVAVGDARVPHAAQATAALHGKVLRINRDGEAAADTRPPPGHDPRVYAAGLREPVAIAFHPGSQELMVAQRRGAQAADEVVLLKRGSNAGWDARCAASAGAAVRPAAGPAAGSTGGYCEPEQPAAGNAWRTAQPGAGVAAMELLRGDVWRGWRNSFVMAQDRGQRLEMVLFDDDGRLGRTATALKGLGFGFGALAQQGDALFVATRGKPGGDEIWRLSLY